MEKLSKQAVLNKTHYGIGVYAHILRLYYPEKSCKREQSSNEFEAMPSAADFARSDRVVIKLKERDCGLSRNPFNGDKETLHIWIEKDDISGAEFAKHEDKKNAIPAGDAFTFAELHYKQQDEELLQTLNEELNLRIGEKSCKRVQNSNLFEVMPSVADFGHSQKRNFYSNAQKPIQNSKIPHAQSSLEGGIRGCLFSFFKSPISNTQPYKKVSLLDIYKYTIGDYAKQRTKKLRAISDVQLARKFKALNFDYCTFSGTFNSRSDKALIKHSGLLCVDFDHLPNIALLRNQLLQDEYFDTQLLFVSPSGDGLKWIISIDTAQATHSNYFTAVANYILQTYGVEVDKSGRDISRACFLPHDPQAFINPLILK